MNKLSKAGTTDFTVLGANHTSKIFECIGPGTFSVYIAGTFSSQTVTMQFSPDGITFVTFGVDLDGSGVAVAQTWTGAADEVNPRGYKGVGGMFFRFTVSNGGSPSITPYFAGKNVDVKEQS